MIDAFHPAFRQRAHSEIAIFHKGAQYTVGEILDRAQRYSEKIRKYCASTSLPEGGGCFIIPSENPASYMAAFLACSHANVRMLPWRETSFSIEKVAALSNAAGMLQFSSDIGLGEMEILPLSEEFRPTEGAGDLVMMTSGSSGEPKGVLLDVEKVVLNNTAAGCIVQPDRCDIWAIDLDMALMSATSHMIMAWQYKIPLYHLTGLDDATINKIFSKSKVGFGGAPIQLLRLIKILEQPNSPFLLFSSGDFLTREMIDRLQDKFPETIITKVYGLTELGGRFCALDDARLQTAKDSVGSPLPGFKLKIEKGDPKDEFGIISAYSPCQFDGYLLADGSYQPHTEAWVSTGDLGEIGTNGLLRLLGRADDVIKVNGEKVDKNTIDSALSGILSDREYYVMGVAHQVLGQCLALFVCSTDKVPPITWKEIVLHLKNEVGNNFIPPLMFDIKMPGFPRLANGKIDRDFLKRNHHSFDRLK